MSKFFHPLMDNNISNDDLNSLLKFIKKNKKKIFTQSIQVQNLENEWSQWLGVK